MNFNNDQILYIRLAIGIWLNLWKDKIVVDYRGPTHRIGFAKEQLKMLICPAKPDERFNEEEIDFICYTIGDWYIKWKHSYIDKENKTHCLSKACDDLFVMLVMENKPFSLRKLKYRPFYYRLFRLFGNNKIESFCKALRMYFGYGAYVHSFTKRKQMRRERE